MTKVDSNIIPAKAAMVPSPSAVPASEAGAPLIGADSGAKAGFEQNEKNRAHDPDHDNDGRRASADIKEDVRALLKATEFACVACILGLTAVYFVIGFHHCVRFLLISLLCSENARHTHSSIRYHDSENDQATGEHMGDAEIQKIILGMVLMITINMVRLRMRKPEIVASLSKQGTRKHD